MPPTPDSTQIYRTMLLARMLDERLWNLIRQGKGHFAVPESGHEGAGVYAFALDPRKDYLAPHYRDLVPLLHYGVTLRDILCGFFARANDPSSGGRQMFAHWSAQNLNILSLSSPQPNHVTHAAGAAFASKYRKDGAVAWCAFGEGSASKGDVPESMNFAAIHKLPLIFCCENNGYAISVPHQLEMAKETVVDRAAGYGIPGVLVDGSDPLAVYAAAREAVDRARTGGGPSFIEVKCYRYFSHTSNDDDQRYRSREEVTEARKNDPVACFRQRLMEGKVWDEAKEQSAQTEFKVMIDDAVAFAEASPSPVAEDLFRHIYAE